MTTNNKQKLVMIDGRKRRRQIEHRSFSRVDVFKSLENLRLDRVQDAAVERRSNRNGLDMEMDLYESTEWLVREKRQMDDLDERLQEFTNYFVQQFEEKLTIYDEVLRKVKSAKEGKFSQAFSGPIGSAIGGAVGGAIGFLIAMPAQGAKAGTEVGAKLTEAIGDKIGKDYHSKK
ncbi:MAG TPA: hypothetical protein VK133_00615, partial [Amoebophilaceae bacterium]|nr:hypothetical protein [Amoebophilaceae bacterium]